MIRKKIEMIILNNLQLDYMDENLLHMPLKDIGINSLNFVKIVVEIEDELDIEFDDTAIIESKYQNLLELINYVLRIAEGNTNARE
jgi:Phosphopantetheine attachment site.